jgi:hypothetical protein
MGMHHMAHYRANFIGRDGRFERAIDLDCVNDDAAKESVRNWSTASTLNYGGEIAG